MTNRSNPLHQPLYIKTQAATAAAPKLNNDCALKPEALLVTGTLTPVDVATALSFVWEAAVEDAEVGEVVPVAI